MTCNEIFIGYAPVLAIRITYMGELGWELHMPVEYATYIYDLLWEAGRSFELTNVGYRAIDSLRLEKGYRYWSGDISPEYTPFEAGLDFCVKMNKGDFIGRSSLRNHQASLLPDHSVRTLDACWQGSDFGWR